MGKQARKNRRKIASILDSGGQVGGAVSDMLKNGVTPGNIMRALKGGKGMISAFKSKKGGVYSKGGRVYYKDNGLAPFKQYYQRRARRGPPRVNSSAGQQLLSAGRSGRSYYKQPAGQFYPPRSIGKAMAVARSDARQTSATATPMMGVRSESLVFSKTETVGTIYGSGNGTYYRENFSIQPGNFQLLSWGANIVQNYQHYNLIGITFIFTSTMDSDSSGEWAVNAYPDPNINVANQFPDMKDVKIGTCAWGDVKDHLTLMFPISELTQKRYDVRVGATAPSGNLQQADLGVLVIGSTLSRDDNNPAVIGTFSIAYAFTLRTPQPRPFGLTTSQAFNYAPLVFTNGQVDGFFSSNNITLNTNYEPTSQFVFGEIQGVGSVATCVADFRGIIILNSYGSGFPGNTDIDDSGTAAISIAPDNSQSYFVYNNATSQEHDKAVYIIWVDMIANTGIRFVAGGAITLNYMFFTAMSLPFTSVEGGKAYENNEAPQMANSLSVMMRIKSRNKTTMRHHCLAELPEIKEIEEKGEHTMTPSDHDRPYYDYDQVRSNLPQDVVKQFKASTSRDHTKNQMSEDLGGIVLLLFILFVLASSQNVPPAFITTKRPTTHKPTSTFAPTSPTSSPVVAPTRNDGANDLITFNCTINTSFTIFGSGCKHNLVHGTNSRPIVTIHNDTAIRVVTPIKCGVTRLMMVLTYGTQLVQCDEIPWTVHAFSGTTRKAVEYSITNTFTAYILEVCGPVGLTITFVPNTVSSNVIDAGRMVFVLLNKYTNRGIYNTSDIDTC